MQTAEGDACWRLVTDMSGSLRGAGLGEITGFDLSEMMNFGVARGLCAETLAHYLPAADGGLRAGLAKTKKERRSDG